MPSADKIRKDARGAMARSQGDSRNDGVHSANPVGDRDATRKPDDHSPPRRPVTGPKPGARTVPDAR